ncbi:MAG: molybdopterin molybdenumtransferase MoeA, partial [Ardenticatenia bacterium]
MPESKWPLLPVSEARRIILEHVQPLGTEERRFEDAQGYVLAEDVRAREPMPPFPARAKDGFAVIADDTTEWRRIVGDQFAGYDANLRVEYGTAARITTGAPVPQGANAIIMVEFSEVQGDRVRFTRRVEPGADIRPVGQDIAQGQVVLPAGTRLGPAELGLLATVGATRITVWKRPRIGVMSTGDELVEPDETPGPGQIRDANRFSLMAA